MTSGPIVQPRRLLRYLAVGICSVAIDAVVYWFVAAAFGAPLFVAKPIGYVGGAVFAYFANWKFTFGARRGRLSEVAFVLVYLSSLTVNEVVNQVFLLWMPDEWWRAPLAFLVTTGFTTVWNFLGMSLFVFKGKPPAADPTDASPERQEMEP